MGPACSELLGAGRNAKCEILFFLSLYFLLGVLCVLAVTTEPPTINFSSIN